MSAKNRSPWFWVPSLYYAEGIPYIVAMTVSVIMYKTMGISNAQIAFWTSILYLPWTFKPLWSPFIDIYSTKRNWITIMQLLLAITFGGVALVLNFSWFFVASLILLGFTAFSSATHDIACDGYYMLGLNQHEQTWFVGIRSTFYRFAMLTGQGLLIILAGYIESNTGLAPVGIHVSAGFQQISAQPVLNDSLNDTEQESDLRIIVSSDTVFLTLSPNEPAIYDSTIIFFRLSKTPQAGESIVVNFGRKEGSKDLKLITDGRMVFTEETWNQPLAQIIVSDPRLQHPTQATFRATAGNTALSWSITFTIMMAMFLVFALYHKIFLPFPSSDFAQKVENMGKSFFDVFITFFKKEKIGAAIAFLLLYRLAESQLVKLASPFLLDAQEAGGLALTTGQVGFVYGTVGLIGLILGGLLGGFAAARYGLKKWIWWMAVAINLPDIVYVYLSYAQPGQFWLINICVGIEQFGYGFGFTGYMLFMIFISEGKYKTSHFAITTSFMALGMMIPGMISGYIQEFLGYHQFFIWVVIATIPSFIAIKFIHLDPTFGIKNNKSSAQ